MVMRNRSGYVITTGWWCVDGSGIKDERLIFAGVEEVRKVDFFKDWYAAVNRFTNPEKILVVDSASPVKPELPDDPRLEFISLDRNPGHATNHKGKYAGVTLAHILGMTYAFCCDVDYWVYIEQDALIFGDGIIEKAISEMRGDYMWGSGRGIPQPMQQSFMIFRTAAIPVFLKSLTSIRVPDGEMSPEMKFVVAASAIAKWLPERLFADVRSSSFLARAFRKLRHISLTLALGGRDVLPFGYGRQRPINFDDRFFYFQEASMEELRTYFRLFYDAVIK